MKILNNMSMNEDIKVHIRELLRLLMKIRPLRNSLRKIAMKGLLPISITKRLPVEDVFEVHIHDNKGFMYSSLACDAIGRALFWRGLFGYEKETLEVFCSHLAGAAVFIDVGANTGIYSLAALALDPALTVVAFEPVEKVRRILEKNISINKWESRCVVRGEAVSNQGGTAIMHIPFSKLPSSSSLNREGFRGYEGELIECNAITIDEIVEELCLSAVNVIKIDVEGFEDCVLEGMKKTLEKYYPKIFIEVNPDGPYKKVEEILERHGYLFYWLSGEGPILYSRILPDKSEKFRNYLCIPRQAE